MEMGVKVMGDMSHLIGDESHLEQRSEDEGDAGEHEVVDGLGMRWGEGGGVMAEDGDKQTLI